LIITGHMYVHPSGKAHPEMTGVYSDDLVPSLAELAEVVHQAGGRVVAQINHGGMQCSSETVPEPLAPSPIGPPFAQNPARQIEPDEIESLIDAYAQAARRVQAAGFDGVQLHGAHGYLISQFLSPYVNRRTDQWGGDFEGRIRFLRRVSRAVRQGVGPDYPLLIKLGLADGVDGGLAPEEGARVAAALADVGLDGVEISGGIQSASLRSGAEEGYFRPLAQTARPATDLPLILVGGFRSRTAMEDTLVAGEADLISLSRPLIAEPDLPNRLQREEQESAARISCNRCWPDEPGEGIACKGLKNQL
jgi:2,4-dienoyl-CoA reductase-like NADH-dependent reductase (Old Yellow Enzyme family)